MPKLYTPSLLICLALGVGSAASFIAQASAQAPVSPAGSPASDAPGDVTGTLARPELATVRVELERLADGLAADGLPAVMIEEKAAEGLSKRVPAPLIVRACVQVAERLRAGRETLVTLGLPVQEDLLRALVDAQAVGATPAALVTLGQQVRAPVRRERVRATLAAAAAVAELGERDFPIADALSAVGDALRAGGPVAVGALVTNARGLRGSPQARGQALRARAEHGRPESPGRSGSSQGNGPPHDVGYGQGQGRGRALGMR
ncbi:MAG: hypothetical protein H6725_06985 [Sandaracinaceae bacterium]|nr:hypothetical protein [Sandaracinaceae bacterium]